MIDNGSIVTLTLCHFPAKYKWWAFSQMRKGPSFLQAIPGVKFSRLMGSGKGAGFSLQPNFSVYAVLMVWQDWDALAAFKEATYLHRYLDHAKESFTAIMRPVQSKGQWSGREPFELAEGEFTTQLRVVITRATIRKSKLIHFWRQVPATSRAIEQAAGRIFSIGIGEWPWVQQATFSIWEDEAALHGYAYQNAAHREAIRQTQVRQWYKEELFARFAPVVTVGSWNGQALLQPYGITSFEAWPPPSELQAAANA